MQLTTAQIFHHRWGAALAAKDTAALRELYHPQAVQLSVGTGKTLMGAEAIVSGYQELLGITGGIQTTAVEGFIDLGSAYVAESQQSSGFAEALSYDVFVLDGSRARYHASGSISPRTPGSAPAQTGSPGQLFYRRLWEGMQARDAATVARLYAPDAVQASQMAGTLRGGQAIVQMLQQAWRQAPPARLKSVSAFAEGPDVVAAEAVISVMVKGAWVDLETYDFVVLRAGQAVLNIGGLINPRPAELKVAIEKANDAELRAWQSFNDAMARRPWW